MNQSTQTPTLATLLARHRRAANLTQEDLAERSGIAVRTIQSLESGTTRSAQSATAILLADALLLEPAARAAFIASARRQPLRRPVTTAPNTPAILGRELDLAAIDRLLPTTRLLTLLGPGGVGKTTLARTIDDRHTAACPGSSLWVGLESVQDPDDLLPAVARALDLGEQGDQSLLLRIADAIADRTLLLILDNLEHLTVAASQIAALLAVAPNLTILCTSREALRLREEHLLLIDPLVVPNPSDAPDVLAANPAVALFERSLATATPSRAGHDAPPHTPADLSRIATIVDLLDGLPLAIELAAAQGATLPLDTLRTLLESAGLAVLARGRRDAPGRFATMDAAVGWSVNLLSSDAQRLFLILGAFRGGFTTEAVAGVCAEAGEASLIAGLPLLAESQLIQPDLGATDARFRMLEPIRMVARDRLRASGDEPAIRRAHASWFHRWAQEQARLVGGPYPRPPLDALDADLPNIRSAITTSCDPAVGDPADALATVTALSQYWEVRGRFREGRAALAEALAAAPGCESSTLRMDTIYWSGYFAYMRTDVPAIDQAIAQLVPLAERDGTPEYLTRVRILDVLRRDAAGTPPADIVPLARAAAAMMEDQPHEISWHQTVVCLANLHVQSGDYASALPLLRVYEGWAIERGALLHQTAATDWLGFALLRLGRTEEARALFTQTVIRNLHLELPGVAVMSLLGYALAITGDGASPEDLERGAQLLGAVVQLVETNNYPIGELDTAAMEHSSARIAAVLGESRLSELLAIGAALPREDLTNLVTN